MTDVMEDPVEGQLRAYNARDVEAFLPWFAEDLRVEDGAGKVRFSSRDEMGAFYRDMFASYPDLHCELVSRVRIGPWVLDEERITGRGNPLHVVAIYRVERGRIVHLRLLREDDVVVQP